MTVPSITLSDRTQIPQFGLGVWQMPPQDTARIVTEAMEIGYRHIDAAQMYGNESGVGVAIRNSGLARDDLYVTTKLNNHVHDPKSARASLEKSLEDLRLDRVDLFLIHWPLPTLDDGNFVETWEALIDFRDEGMTTSIGVSNFQPDHVDRIVSATGVAPVVNQIEVHPYFGNRAARRATRSHGAMVQGWSPLGQGAGEISDPVVTSIAERYLKTPAQVILRWHIECGTIVFPKSRKRARLAENYDIFDFSLTPAEVESISHLDKGEQGRIGPHPDTFDYVPR